MPAVQPAQLLPAVLAQLLGKADDGRKVLLPQAKSFEKELAEVMELDQEFYQEQLERYDDEAPAAERKNTLRDVASNVQAFAHS